MVRASNPDKLKNYSAEQVMGVDGSPLTFHGSATLDLHINKNCLATDIVTISLLTAGSILGLDFFVKVPSAY